MLSAQHHVPSSSLIATSSDHCIPPEDKVTNTTTEEDREDDKATVCRTKVKLQVQTKACYSLGGHNQQHDNVGSSKLDSEDECADELLFVGHLEHRSQGW